MKKKIIIASDFDGTLTTKDTMLEFIRHCYGTHGLIIHLLRIMPFLLLMKIKVYPNGKAKERLLRNCFSGKTQTQLSQLAQRFADDNTHAVIRSVNHLSASDIDAAVRRAGADVTGLYLLCRIYENDLR